MRLDGARIDDEHHRDHAEKRTVGPVERKADGIAVRRIDRLGLEGRQKGRGGRPADTEQPLNGVDDVVGGKLAAVVELDPLTQFEVPDQAIGRAGMADREPRLHLGWIIFVPIEIVVGIERVAGHPQIEDLVRV